MPTKNNSFTVIGHQVLEDETRALQNLAANLDDDAFTKACEMVIACRGRVIFCGMGHSGHVAKKSAANMSSLSKAAYFLHAGDAVHGDLGVVQPDDLVFLISNSGETDEVLAILPHIKQLGAKTIAIVGNLQSTLARECDLALYHGAEEEAGPFKIAGSSSLINSMALCDALVMAVADAQGYTNADYFAVHPGGEVGRKLREKLK